jgi:hypothetical protein
MTPDLVDAACSCDSAHGQTPTRAVRARARAAGLTAIQPDTRVFIERMARAGASDYSIAAALNASDRLPPYGLRWHWKQVRRLLLQRADLRNA